MLKNSLRLFTSKDDKVRDFKTPMRPLLDDLPIVSSSIHIMKDKMAM